MDCSTEVTEILFFGHRIHLARQSHNQRLDTGLTLQKRILDTD